MEEFISVKDKNVIVTGGSRGIGLAISKLFAKNGAKIHGIYRTDVKSANDTLASIGGSGHQFLQCDIQDPEAIALIFDQLKKQLDQIDIVINNAGICYHHPVDKSSYNAWQKGWQDILATNLIGPSNICFQAAQIMIKQGFGHIINVSSRGAFRGEPEQPAYGASKAGLNALTQSLAFQLAPYGIFVGGIAPGFVETDMAYERLKGEAGDKIRSQSPMNRVATPEEVAEAVFLMACSNQWMTGGIFDVNGASYFRT